MARRRRSRHRRNLSGLGAIDTGTILIGVGILAGLGTLTYYFLAGSGGGSERTDSTTGGGGAQESGPSASEQWAKIKQSMTPEQLTQYREAAKKAVEQQKTPYKAARDAYVAAKATYTPSLYE